MYLKINSLRKVKMRETESGLAENSSSSSLPHTKTSRKPVTQSIFSSCGEGKHTARHPRRPRGSQSGREKGRDESFQVGAKKPLGTDSHRAISKNSRGCRPLIGHKKCFVLLCPIGEQFLPSSFREFVHDGYCLATLARFVHQACASKGNFYFLLS